MGETSSRSGNRRILWFMDDSHPSLLAHNELPSYKNEARRLQAKAACFTILDGRLLRRSFSSPYLKCMTPTEANYVLVELHEEECGNHFGGRSLANRALTVGYLLA